ncbi:hypothetical protein [Bradyrhizobium sp. WSM1253]|uniref:hypothetical protein n=1 Tax=Bradyrhizobium sp. WSM1253 TaxID=319003 RepID=UPI0012F47A13|nr:hypothetical protein [Bradyrhizobium sp. WSM1253]
MPLLDESTSPIDLTKRIDRPEGFYVTPRDPSMTRGEIQLLASAGLFLCGMIVVAIIKRTVVLKFLREGGYNTAAKTLRATRKVKAMASSVGREIERRATEDRRDKGRNSATGKS